MAVQVQLKLPEIYEVLCPKCQEKLRQLIIAKMGDDMIKQALEQSQS